MGPWDERCGPDVDQHQFLHPGGLGHAGRAGGSALAGVLTVGVHHRLVVPAHAQHHVRAPSQLDDGVAGLGISGEYDAAVR